MKTIEKICKACKQVFNAPTKEVSRGNGNFCSIKCGSQSRKLFPKVKENNCRCSWCNKEFYRSFSNLKKSKSGLFFCSRKCKDNAQVLDGMKEIHPAHYGTSIGDRSYRAFAFREKPHKCEKCFYDKIKEILEVHHKDRNRENNNIDNLEILCPNCHNEEHYLTKSGKWANKIMWALGDNGSILHLQCEGDGS